MSLIERDLVRIFAPPAVSVEHRADGSLRVSSPQPLNSFSRCVGDWLERWANERSQTIFLAERGSNGSWNFLTYQQARSRVRRIGSWLLMQNLPAESPVAILSDNSIEHALLALAAMHVGIPVVPISPAYSLLASDFGKLKSIVSRIDPSDFYVSDVAAFAPVLEAVRGSFSGIVVVPDCQQKTGSAVAFSELLSCLNGPAVDAAFAAINAESVAKLLFVSGSTGKPKGVINTQRMLCANQQQILQVWPFTVEAPPVLVDWLPWNHTLGGNYNFNLVLRSGGTLYIDQGRPAPKLFAKTLDNLRECPRRFISMCHGDTTC